MCFYNQTMSINEIGTLIKKYRTASGLSQSELALLGCISRATLIALEKGQIKELGASKLFALTNLLGIHFNYPQFDSTPDDVQNLQKALASANVSYKKMMTAEMLEQILLKGKISKGLEGNMLYVIDELPPAIMLGVIRSVASKAHKKPREVWLQTAALAKQIQSPASLWQVVK